MGRSDFIASGIAMTGIASFGLLGCLVAEAAPVYHVRDYGAIPDERTDSGPAIRAAIQAAIEGAAGSDTGAEVRLEAGTYRIAPERPRAESLPIVSPSPPGFAVRGTGPDTLLVFTDPGSAGLSVRNSRNVDLRDFSIDYDPLPFTQGTIRAVNREAGHFDLEIEAGYPALDGDQFVQALDPHGRWGIIMDRAKRRIKAGTPDHFMTPRWEKIDDGHWRFFTASEHFRRQLTHMHPGDAYAHLGRSHASAIFAQWTDGFRIENITVHAAPSTAVGLVGNSGDVVVRGLEVRFAPGSTRLLTTNADGVHCQQNRTGPIIENCYFEGMADDAINIYAPPSIVHEVRSPREWLVSAGGRIRPGDQLQILDPRTGKVRGVARAVSVRPDGRHALLEVDTPVDGIIGGSDHRSGDTLYNLDACGAGFQIRGNHFYGHRRYGCLLRAGNGIVEDNVFEETMGAGVVLTNEPDWPEGPAPWNIVIRGNRFIRGGASAGYGERPHGAALSIRGSRLGHATAEGESIHGITVENNTFIDRPGAAIYIGGATDVTLRGNRIEGGADVELRRRGGAIVLERASSITITDTTVADVRPNMTSAIEILRSVQAGDAVTITNLKSDLAPGKPAIVDQRP
jgi:hypothetical protein